MRKATNTITDAMLQRAAQETIALARREGSGENIDETRAPTLTRLNEELNRLEREGKTVQATRLGERFETFTKQTLEQVELEALQHRTARGPEGVAKRDLTFGGASSGRTALLHRLKAPLDGSKGDVSNDDVPGGRGPTYTMIDANGVERPLAYDPTIKREPVWKAYLRELLSIDDMRAKFKIFKERVDKVTAGISDEDLMWSLSRFDSLAGQEGILRQNGQSMVNQWQDGGLTFEAKPEDFADATLDRDSLINVFKTAMDLEEPASRYSFAAAYVLHNHFPRVSHFMGSTLGERVLKVALKGESGSVQKSSAWWQEEDRHGDILENLLKAVRLPNEPVLNQAGGNSVMRKMNAGGAKNMMMSRAAAELSAAMAYLTIKANAKEGSNAERAIDGIFRDEVYHYVLMRAANRAAYGMNNRINHLVNIYLGVVQNKNQEAVDRPKHSALQLLAVLESGYAMNAIDARVHKFLEKFSNEELKEKIGAMYPTDKAVQQAVERGEHVLTRPFVMEQNPDLSFDDIKELERRFPGDYDLKKRAIRESEIQAIIDDYRTQRLTSSDYWLGKKGFSTTSNPRGGVTLARALEDGDLRLHFERPGATPTVEVKTKDGIVGLQCSMRELTMREIGLLMDTTSASALAFAMAENAKSDPQKLGDMKTFYKDIAAKLGPSKKYRAQPLPVIADLT